jgi:hypothetical protein
MVDLDELRVMAIARFLKNWPARAQEKVEKTTGTQSESKHPIE